MYNTMPKSSAGVQLLRNLLIIAALVYGIKNREKIYQGVSDFLAKNQLVQNTVEGSKMIWDAVRPQTEAEKAQQKAYLEREQKKADEYRAVGIQTHIRYIGPDDPEWKETAEFTRKLKQGEIR